MNIFQNLAEQRIREAIDRGELTNLPGEGEPLDLNENPFEPPEMRMAIKLLKNNGFKLPWIEKLIDIRYEIDQVKIVMREIDISQSTRSKPDQMDILRKRVQQINKKILDYNICAPNAQLQIPILNLERLIEEIEKSKDRIECQ